jgi:hypothetical protein
MQRQIFIVSATIVDANGAYANLSGYPKTFDSHNYGDDIDKTQRRAIGDMSETYGAMCKRDDRQLQTVMVMTADGFVVEKKSIGKIADLPDPEPVEETNEPE